MEIKFAPIQVNISFVIRTTTDGELHIVVIGESGLTIIELELEQIIPYNIGSTVLPASGLIVTSFKRKDVCNSATL